MVLTKLSYGLANQMFQYAAGRALSIRTNQPLELDLTFFNTNSEEAARPSHEQYQLNIFKGFDIHQQIDSKRLAKLTNKFSKNIFYRALNKLTKELALIPLYNYQWEKNFLKFDPSINNSFGKLIYLNGYFQNEKYFEDVKDYIRNDFIFREELIDTINLELGLAMQTQNSVSIHVRRGDYVGKRFIPSIKYYEKSIATIASKIDNPIFYVFSDDSDWASQNIKAPGQFHYITHNTKEKSYQDMYLMSKCMHNIIANSSFSWWGAWLNDNEAKIVISPKQWLPENEVSSSDIIPNSWIQIEARQ